MSKIPQKITVGSILKFTLPTTVMMIFMSMYSNVDGIFVANLVGETALSAMNIVFPAMSVVIGISVMLATGANAIIARNLGEGDESKARSQFTFIIILGVLIGVLIIIIGAAFIKPIVKALGATEKLTDYCVDYLFIILMSAPLSILQMLFQSFFVTAGKPNLGLCIVAAGGVTNIILDYVFMGPCAMGIKGAALGTLLGNAVPAVFGLIYFFAKRQGTLFFVKPRWDFRMLGKSCFNGSSEMVTNLASAVTTFLFNYMMLKFLAEDGVAAITIALYLQFFLSSVYMGFSMGVGPVFSYNYGRKDTAALKKLFRISIGFVAINSVIWFGLSLILKNPLISIFAKKGTAVFEIAAAGWGLFSLTFLLNGFNIFASALFTAFSDGKSSAIISFMRTFVFLCACIMVLPLFLEVKGIWLAVPIAEVLSLIVSVTFLVVKRKKFEY